MALSRKMLEELLGEVRLPSDEDEAADFIEPTKTAGLGDLDGLPRSAHRIFGLWLSRGLSDADALEMARASYSNNAHYLALKRKHGYPPFENSHLRALLKMQ